MLYNHINARLLLGALIINPQLLNNSKYTINKYDFEPIEFHLRLFQAIVFLAKHGAKSIEAIDIYSMTTKYKAIKELFDQNQLSDFIDTVKQLTNLDNFDLYYEEVKKCSVLRKYQSYGFDISKFENNTSEASLKDIIDHFEGIQIAVKKEFFKDKNIEEIKAGNGFEAIKEQFKDEPMYGATTFSRYLNTVSRGWIQGQLSVYSMPSGSGKSTIGLYNIAQVACPYLYDEEQKQYVSNKCYQHKAALYIQFEMDAETEITPKLLASISGVPTFHILNGKYDEGEEERIDKAIEVLHQSDIYIVTMPSFTVDLIETYIRDYVLNHNVGYVVYDYITETATASSDIATKNKVQTRSDQVLSAITSKLKDIAAEYNVAILSFTQVNANINTQEILDASVVAGSRAIQNKCDVAGVVTPLRSKEMEICDMMMDNHFPDCKIKPNRILHLYKIRFSNYEQGTKIWFYLDLNTGRTQDYFVTTKYNQPYQVTKTNLIYGE